MRLPTSREKLASSQRRYERLLPMEWRYREFFFFLSVSPSYRLARLIKTGKIDRSTAKLPQDFAVIEATYEAFGDLTQTFFWEWWVKTAQYPFQEKVQHEPCTLLKLNSEEHASDKEITVAQTKLAEYIKLDRLAQGNPATLVIAVPLHANRKIIMQNINQELDQAYADGNHSVSVAKWTVLRNKLHHTTVHWARVVLRSRAYYPDEQLFKIGTRANFSPELQTAIESGDADAKRLMQILTSRHLHRAYLLAENAARGRFPTFEPLPEDEGRPGFDYRILGEELLAHNLWLRKKREQEQEIKASKYLSNKTTSRS